LFIAFFNCASAFPPERNLRLTFQSQEEQITKSHLFFK
jgi:hypothetical protein